MTITVREDVRRHHHHHHELGLRRPALTSSNSLCRGLPFRLHLSGL
jgi:hypothetical protein